MWLVEGFHVRKMADGKYKKLIIKSMFGKYQFVLMEK